MKFDSRLLLPAILAIAGIAVVWSGLDGSESEEQAGSEPISVPSQPSGGSPTTTSQIDQPPSTTVPGTTVASTTTTTFPSPAVLMDVHPPLVDIDGWLQSEVETLQELRGQVVIVEFWTFGCYNCKNRIPYTQDLYAKYHSQGLEIVGIHSPEFKYEEDVENISAAMADLGVTWPVVLDRRRRTFWEWQTGGRAYWPRTYVLDREGRVRFDHIGEGKYRELEQTVAFLLDEGA